NIHWPGVFDNTDMNRPFLTLLEDMLTLPVPGKDWPDTQIHGYGLGVPFIVLTLAALALVWVLARFLGSLLAGQPDRRLGSLLYTRVPVLATAETSPALWSSRYNLHIPVALMLLVTAWADFQKSARLRDGIVVPTILTSIMMLWWASPGWSVPVKTALELA